jgi:hypothetical protein
MVSKATQTKELKIVLSYVDKRIYDKVKKLAVEEKRTIGKQAEYLISLALDKLYK